MFADGRWNHARIYVAPEMVDFFRGWLEFASPDHIPGVPHCPSWPKEFRVQELGTMPRAPGIDAEVHVFDVFSPQFERDLIGWCPVFHKHDDIGPTLGDEPQLCGTDCLT